MRFVFRLVLGFVAALALAGCSGQQADPVTVELNVPEGGLEHTIEQELPLGAPVTFRATTAFDDEVHIHGYELTLVTTAGETAEVRFDAAMAGTYEVESHVTDEIYMKLVVR